MLAVMKNIKEKMPKIISIHALILIFEDWSFWNLEANFLSERIYSPPGNIKERQLIDTADTNSKINPMSSIKAAPKTSNKNKIMLTDKYVEVAISL